MKINKTAIFISSILLLAACTGGNSTSDTKTGDSAEAVGALKNTAGLSATAYTAGATLIANNDCYTCHEIDQRSTGPSFHQIADHYGLDSANVENLAYKIIKGGIGAWGNVQMTAHPGSSVPEAKDMARYILSLKADQ